MRANDEQLAVVQDKVSRGEYEVNSQRVAIAILERIGVMQTDVSKPRRWSWPATGNERPPGSLSRTAPPATTRPISCSSDPVGATASAHADSAARGIEQSSS